MVTFNYKLLLREHGVTKYCKERNDVLVYYVLFLYYFVQIVQ